MHYRAFLTPRHREPASRRDGDTLHKRTKPLPLRLTAPHAVPVDPQRERRVRVAELVHHGAGIDA